MKYYDASKPLYLGADTSSISLEAGLLQVKVGMNYGQDKFQDNTALCTIAFASKSLFNMKQQYSNIQWEAFGILHGLEKFHHYCFTK